MLRNTLKTNDAALAAAPAKALCAGVLTVALAAGGVGSIGALPTRAFADDAQAAAASASGSASDEGANGAVTGPVATDINAAPDEFQQKVEQTAAAYDAANQRVDDLNQQIADNEQRISELEAELPDQKAKSADAVRVLYKMQQNAPGLVQMILGAENLNDFLTSFEYVSHIQQSNTAQIERLQEMQSELEGTRASLADAKKSADAEQANAAQALADAQAAREEAQRKAQEEAQRQAEQAAAAAAAAQASQQAQAEAQAQASGQKADASQSPAQDQSAGNAPAASSPSVDAPSSDGADWSSDKESFVNQWAVRIDAYLAGSPMAGQGRTFAEAAWTYGVDPRWSPAISNTESSKGLYCFAPYNAWGWGSGGWGSWEEAINDHVAGLARGYGYTISPEAAQKYCPPNWEHWYNATLAQMNMI